MQFHLGYVGNGSFCQEPVKEATGFLLLSQGKIKF